MVVGRASVGIEKVLSAWDESVIGAVPIADEAGAEQAMATAYAVYADRNKWLPVEKRVAIFSKAKEIMSARIDDLILQAATEGGKPLNDSRVELVRAIDGMQSCIECMRASHGEEIPMGINASSINRLAMTHHEPIGVVLAYSAFNHPMNLIVHQVAPALAAGCPVVVKPAPTTPLSCFAFVEIMREAGLPEEYCQALFVDVEIASKLVADERVGFFSFIGHSDIGWMLRSKLAGGTRCSLEHGGIAPVILAEDADLSDSLPLIAKGGFYHAGQVCVSVQKVFAHNSIVDRVVDQLSQLVAEMKVGDPTSPDTDVGPLIRPASIDRLDQLVADAVANGAQLVCGGKRIGNTTFECTVLLNPSSEARVSREEIFGPIICVYGYDDIEEAVQCANDTPYSFQSAVFSRNIDTAMYCYRHLDAATVMVNDHTAFRVDWMPFAGHKRSGHGTGGIRYTFEDMQAKKLLILRSKSL